jgi:hypothetical protein
MSNDPFPSAAQLRLEAAADRLLVRQAVSTEALGKLVERFRADFARLDFPLGSPVPGYALEDIDEHARDWVTLVRTPADLESAAMDAARQEMMG